MADFRAQRTHALAAIAWLMAAALLGASAPAFGRGNVCFFQARGLSMSFGTLNPASAVNVTVPMAAATLNADQVGDCAPGQGIVISGDNGLNFNGSRRMKHAARPEYIAYSLSLPTPTLGGPGNSTYMTYTFNGTVLGSAYADAWEGTYSDTVILTVTP